jgi:hypothetical protein
VSRTSTSSSTVEARTVTSSDAAVVRRDAGGSPDAPPPPAAFAPRAPVVRPFRRPTLHPSEGGAAAAEAVAPFRTALAALLTGHILRDGEVVQLILKPSLWFILFNCMRFAAVVLILLIGAQLLSLPDHVVRGLWEVGVFLLGGRLMWAVLTWMGRLYVLTDLRVVRLSGVFNVEVADCALRKVGHTRLTRTFREKLWRLGSIEITPIDDSCQAMAWQTVRHPREVHEKLLATIDRARQGGLPCHRD